MLDSQERDFAECLELAQCSGLEISPQMLAIVLELLRLDVAPQGVVAFLRTLKNAKLQSLQQAPQPDRGG